MSNNADFMLESLSYANHSLEELLNTAEREENMLALRIADASKEAGAEEKELEIDGNVDNSMDIPSNVDYIVYEAEWTKIKEGLFIFGEFNEDTNMYNNHVELLLLGERRYRVLIRHDFMGETEYNTTIGGLKEAKKVAERKALELAAKGELGR